jgi:hypothetical protein
MAIDPLIRFFRRCFRLEIAPGNLSFDGHARWPGIIEYVAAFSLQLTAYSLQLTAFVKSHFADEERSFTHAPAFYYKWRMESPV